MALLSSPKTLDEASKALPNIKSGPHSNSCPTSLRLTAIARIGRVEEVTALPDSWDAGHRRAARDRVWRFFHLNRSGFGIPCTAPADRSQCTRVLLGPVSRSH
ncbi:hypothetical protein NDU88_010842 [Pleurodeles waltl]|uniref:Uncharacterized protein n=1 Tax=Pleurodeles waltl TaxID=8319 RepID=A0AAV7PWE4_PLEWA|nr:hypothetical protein NDU88_010842 [Pleurodeles waltl]